MCIFANIGGHNNILNLIVCQPHIVILVSNMHSILVPTTLSCDAMAAAAVASGGGGGIDVDRALLRRWALCQLWPLADHWSVGEEAALLASLLEAANAATYRHQCEKDKEEGEEDDAMAHYSPMH